MKPVLSSLLLAALGASGPGTSSQPMSADELADGFVSLFNGKSLDGWIPEAARPGQWLVEHGKLVCTGGRGWLRTAWQFDDFLLRCEWRIMDPGGNGGLYLRATGGLGDSKPASDHQVQIHDAPDCGALFQGGLNVRPTKQPKKPAGQWNTYEIRCEGPNIQVIFNGEPVTATDRSKLSRGFLGIQAEGARVEFRNLRIKELGFNSLLNGKDLTGWERVRGNDKTWTVRDGLLVCGGGGGSWLSTRDCFADFTLRLEYNLPPDGNSGVYLRAPREGHISAIAMEIQLLDDDHPHYTKLKPFQYTGSIYGVVPGERGHTKPPGEWNRMQIKCEGPWVSVWTNAALVAHGNMDHEEKLKSRPRSGYAGLQNHHSTLTFRGIAIKAPGATAAASASPRTGAAGP